MLAHCYGGKRFASDCCFCCSCWCCSVCLTGNDLCWWVVVRTHVWVISQKQEWLFLYLQQFRIMDKNILKRLEMWFQRKKVEHTIKPNLAVCFTAGLKVCPGCRISGWGFWPHTVSHPEPVSVWVVLLLGNCWVAPYRCMPNLANYPTTKSTCRGAQRVSVPVFPDVGVTSFVCFWIWCAHSSTKSFWTSPHSTCFSSLDACWTASNRLYKKESTCIGITHSRLKQRFWSDFRDWSKQHLFQCWYPRRHVAHSPKCNRQPTSNMQVTLSHLCTVTRSFKAFLPSFLRSPNPMCRNRKKAQPQPNIPSTHKSWP